MIKTFTCDSSTFRVDLRATLFSDSTTSGHWNVIDGTGDFADLKGSGSLVGTPWEVETGITDVYTGKMKNLP